MEFLAFFIAQQWTAAFCAEHEMHYDIGQRLRHWVSPLQGCLPSGALVPGPALVGLALAQAITLQAFGLEARKGGLVLDSFGSMRLIQSHA